MDRSLCRGKEVLCWTGTDNFLPPAGVPLIVTVYNAGTGCRELRYPVYRRKGPYDWMLRYWEYDSEGYLRELEHDVLGWCEFPDPYMGESR